MEIFKNELAALINKYGIDAQTNTPDFMLAEIAVDAIASFGALKPVTNTSKSRKPRKRRTSRKRF